jgi:DNA ligase-1
MKTLYKKTSIGQTQIWSQEISEDGKSFRTVTGKLDGKIVYSAWTECLPKNVGKANATTAEQQCKLEVEANYKKKLAQGNYKETMDEDSLSVDNFFKPMLAKKFGEDYTPTEEDYRQAFVRSQPKLDGVRCIVTKDGMFSRQGKPIISAPHVFETLKPLFVENPDYVFDGELYADKFADNFNEIISLVRQAKPIEEDLRKSEEVIQYFVYDFPSFNNVPFGIRYNMLKCTFEDKLEYKKHIRIVPTNHVKDEEHLNELYAEYMTQGYEGQMVRISKNGYENKRSKQLLKRKEFKDEEFEILEIQEGIGNRAGLAGAILCKAKNGKSFGAGIKGTWVFSKELLKNKSQYIGTLVTIQYQDLTPDGVPRFGVAVKFLGTKEREM